MLPINTYTQDHPNSPNKFPTTQELDQKNKNSLRIILQNINSLQPQYPQRIQDTISKLHELGTDLSLLTEINCNSKRADIYDLLWTISKSISDSASIVTSRVPSTNNVVYQPGGTASIEMVPFIGKIKAKKTDSLGRWSWLEVYKQQENLVIIINDYIPCTQSNLGPLTYQSQLYKNIPALRSINQVKDKFWVELKRFIQTHQVKGNSIILSMDSISNVSNQKTMYHF